MQILSIDGFMASMMAAEGMKGCMAVMHGPGGCRLHTSRLSTREVVREYGMMEGPFYFNHPRIPCTYMDEEDYINGADYKATELLDTVDGVEVCVIISSPGASLIGDDLRGAADRSKFKGTVVVPERCHMSEPAHVGYDSIMADIVNAVCTESETRKGAVNIVGLPTLLKGWRETAMELKGYLEAMGLEVIACVGAGCSVEDLRRSTAAEFNISVLPEYCERTSEAYANVGVKTLYPMVPMGFDFTENWIRDVAKRADVDPTPALRMLNGIKDRASNVMKGSLGEGLISKCATYSMCLESTMVLPMVKWLHSYLSMFPKSIRACEWWNSEYRKSLEGFLKGIHSEDALKDDMELIRSDAMFANGLTAKMAERRGDCSVGIDLWMPSMHRMEFVERPVLGAKGAMRILDDLFYDISKG